MIFHFVDNGILHFRIEGSTNFVLKLCQHRSKKKSAEKECNLANCRQRATHGQMDRVN